MNFDNYLTPKTKVFLSCARPTNIQDKYKRLRLSLEQFEKIIDDYRYGRREFYFQDKNPEDYIILSVFQIQEMLWIYELTALFAITKNISIKNSLSQMDIYIIEDSLRSFFENSLFLKPGKFRKMMKEANEIMNSIYSGNYEQLFDFFKEQTFKDIQRRENRYERKNITFPYRTPSPSRLQL